jgi:hypothetical protein
MLFVKPSSRNTSQKRKISDYVNNRQVLYEMIHEHPELLIENYFYQIQDRAFLKDYTLLLEKCFEEDPIRTQRVIDFAYTRLNMQIPLDLASEDPTNQQKDSKNFNTR